MQGLKGKKLIISSILLIFLTSMTPLGQSISNADLLASPDEFVIIQENQDNVPLEWVFSNLKTNTEYEVRFSYSSGSEGSPTFVSNSMTPTIITNENGEATFSFDFDNYDTPRYDENVKTFELNEELIEYHYSLSLQLWEYTTSGGMAIVIVDGSFFQTNFVFIENATPDQLISELISLVTENDAKNNGVKRSLLSVLNQALSKYNDGRIEQSIDRLNHFIFKVSKYDQNGKISNTDNLIDLAQNIIDLLE